MVAGKARIRAAKTEGIRSALYLYMHEISPTMCCPSVTITGGYELVRSVEDLPIGHLSRIPLEDSFPGASVNGPKVRIS